MRRFVRNCSLLRDAEPLVVAMRSIIHEYNPACIDQQEYVENATIARPVSLWIELFDPDSPIEQVILAGNKIQVETISVFLQSLNCGIIFFNPADGCLEHLSPYFKNLHWNYITLSDYIVRPMPTEMILIVQVDEQ